uniref:DUF7806 domain-containing protein n=1 Tax=Solanum tuberosum TaxID=4113 RepID=M1CHY2_SOLTU
MATLQKFKLLATQCAVAGSPTRSPTTSPVIHLRRRKTLRMLLSRSIGGGGSGRRLPRREVCSPDRFVGERDSTEKGKELVVSHKLKDLFVSSPPSFAENTRQGLSPAAPGAGGGCGIICSENRFTFASAVIGDIPATATEEGLATCTCEHTRVNYQFTSFPMSASLPKMEALYSKLYSKYAKLKKEKDTSMENLNREQEEKFVNYVAAADAVIDHLRSETDRLGEQVNELRSEMTSMRSALMRKAYSIQSAKDEEMIQYQKLLMEENLKSKDKFQVMPACCRRNVDISGDSAADISPASCIFQDLVQWLVGMKFSAVTENEELCISALHESSGLSFSLTLTKNASAEHELVYRVLSLGTFERVAPEWMRDTIMFSPNMCPLFFQRVSRVIKLSY